MVKIHVLMKNDLTVTLTPPKNPGGAAGFWKTYTPTEPKNYANFRVWLVVFNFWQWPWTITNRYAMSLFKSLSLKLWSKIKIEGKDTLKCDKIFKIYNCTILQVWYKSPFMKNENRHFFRFTLLKIDNATWEVSIFKDSPLQSSPYIFGYFY